VSCYRTYVICHSDHLRHSEGRRLRGSEVNDSIIAYDEGGICGLRQARLS
jgi:hypothetical protein